MCLQWMRCKVFSKLGATQQPILFLIICQVGRIRLASIILALKILIGKGLYASTNNFRIMALLQSSLWQYTICKEPTSKLSSIKHWIFCCYNGMNEFSQSELVAHTNITFCTVSLSQLLQKLQLLSKNSSQSLMPILS